MNLNDRSGKRGFTLTELVVSMAILGILSLLLVGMLSQVGQSWSQVKGQIDTRQIGRTVLAQMAADVRVAALPKDRRNLRNLQFVIDPSAIAANSSGGPNYMFPHCFFWQAPIATDTTKGNMAEVGYFVRWDTTTSATNPRAMLCRYFVNPSDSNYLIYSNPTAWLSTTTGAGSLDAVAPGTSSSTQSQNYRGWVADNVIGLWVRGLDTYGKPIVLTTSASSPFSTVPGSVSGYANYVYDSRKGYLQGQSANIAYGSAFVMIKTGVVDGGAGGNQLIFWSTLPPTVEIAVVVLDSKAAAKVTATGTNSIATSGTSSPYNLLGSGTAATASNPLTPTNMWAEIEAFRKALPTAVQNGARVYATRVQLVNGG